MIKHEHDLVPEIVVKILARRDIILRKSAICTATPHMQTHTLHLKRILLEYI